MLTLLTSEQTRMADQYTITNEPISSIGLMERASAAFVRLFKERYPDSGKTISIYCGTGNNGGDGLVIARLLAAAKYKVHVKIARFSEKASADFETSLERLRQEGIEPVEFNAAATVANDDADLVIDALLGSGLNKSLEGEWRRLAEQINESGKPVIAVDVPTGFRTEGEQPTGDVVIKSDLTITFQRPAINFLLPVSADYISEFVVADIGLDEAFIQSADSPYSLLTDADISERLKPRLPFSHKGTYGHALLIAGAPQTMGAALLCAEACLFAGAGLTSACIPEDGLTALNVRVPEVMALIRKEGKLPAQIAWDKYSAIGAGPGLGNSAESLGIIEEMLRNYKKPVVFDADALNIISENYELMSLVPEGSVFTPHVKEFDRLFGKHSNWWDRLQTGIDRATTLGCTIVLKNRYSIVFTPSGQCLFNPTGTPSMATGGSGDVLTGIITSFVAQGYSPRNAAILGVFIHGRSGEEITRQQNAAVLPAAQLIKGISGSIAALTHHIK